MFSTLDAIFCDVWNHVILHPVSDMSEKIIHASHDLLT